MGKLFEFAFCQGYDSKIAYLASLCPEKWSFGTSSDNVILKNYVDYTFRKLEEEGKVLEEEACAIFNTGLFTPHYEPIYAYFIPNRIPGRQKWFLDGFYGEYQLAGMRVDTTHLPARANYFSDPADLVFDTNCKIIPQYKHIFDDPANFERLPESVRNSSNKTVLFDGAIRRATLMIAANYKTAVPQYHMGRIQLLVPVCLCREDIPDLALVVSKVRKDKDAPGGNAYLGHTCLTLNMAYNNARLIARPDSAWLRP